MLLSIKKADPPSVMHQQNKTKQSFESVLSYLLQHFYSNDSFKLLYVVLYFLYALQSSSYSCGAGGVGCCLHTDQSPAVGSQKCWYLQQPPSGKSNALHSTFLCIKGCICSGSVVTFTKFVEICGSHARIFVFNVSILFTIFYFMMKDRYRYEKWSGTFTLTATACKTHSPASPFW